ncbi:MAG TPA: gliding motility-associated C-terminal domain-containing protein, partial [Ohtaekwangia sp.]|nr:gliding motility-associated C-terminal domain-containing protein [Ohtaekwangia sp.]
VNDVPVIVGQVALATGAGVPLEITLTQLTVTDPDNAYPQDFTLHIGAGQHYSVSGTTITPAASFSGTLNVSVTVRDGVATSAPYFLKIEVTKGVTITGQRPRQVNEDETATLGLEDLIVNDPTGVYPSGYKLLIGSGENFTVDGSSIIPAANFAGTLSFPVSVSNGNEASNTYQFQLPVAAINDAPEIKDLETDALPYAFGNTPVPVSQSLVVADVDDTQLVLAEIGFRRDYYREGSDSLHFTNLPAIRGVFDAREGIMSLIGVASLADYQSALRQVRYSNNSQDDANNQKVIYIKINDGENVSLVYERTIVMREDIALEIPNAFTPNSDLANDTWRIRAFEKSEKLTKAVVRVYSKRGVLVYEAQGFEQEWDGRFQDELLPADTYFYTIDLNLAHVNTHFKGAVTILR